jgi:hypothetical protein
MCRRPGNTELGHPSADPDYIAQRVGFRTPDPDASGSGEREPLQRNRLPEMERSHARSGRKPGDTTQGHGERHAVMVAIRLVESEPGRLRPARGGQQRGQSGFGVATRDAGHSDNHEHHHPHGANPSSRASARHRVLGPDGRPSNPMRCLDSSTGRLPRPRIPGPLRSGDQTAQAAPEAA